MWDVTARGLHVPPVAFYTGAAASAAELSFSPDGKLLATVGYEAAAELWDTTATGEVTQPVIIGANEDYWGGAVAFHPNGTLLATISSGNPTQLWDPAASGEDTQPIATFGATSTDENVGGSGILAFSPDGKLLATGRNDNAIELWDTTVTGEVTQPLATFFGHTNVITDLAFSPGSDLLASSSDDGTIRVWDVAARGRIDQPTGMFVGPSGAFSSLTFRPDDRLLATYTHGFAGLWDLDTERLVENACAEFDGRITEAEWNAVLPEVPYDPPCT